VVIAAPETPETKHLIGAAELARMKPGARLINVSRGTLVDEDALIRALLNLA
jgi:phosphoglycerate dehydrogenase-like enzyme